MAATNGPTLTTRDNSQNTYKNRKQISQHFQKNVKTHKSSSHQRHIHILVNLPTLCAAVHKTPRLYDVYLWEYGGYTCEPRILDIQDITQMDSSHTDHFLKEQEHQKIEQHAESAFRISY